MVRKDFLQAEIEKLAQVLAKIIKLKNDGAELSAEELTLDTLTENFGFSWEEITDLSVEDFEKKLRSKEFAPEKLDILSQFLFESVYPFEEIPETDEVLHKVLEIFAMLEKEHKTQSLDNLNRQVMIDRFLNSRQHE